MLDKISAGDIMKYFSHFFPEEDFDIQCKLSPVEIIYMKCQSLFSGKIR